jgi:hypothetical protein
MYPKAILEKFAEDRALALASGEERACGKKIRYESMVKATKAAYNLEVKSPAKFLILTNVRSVGSTTLVMPCKDTCDSDIPHTIFGFFLPVSRFTKLLDFFTSYRIRQE